MWSRARKTTVPDCVGFAPASSALHAARIRAAQGARPRLLWTWQHAAGDLPQALRALSQARSIRSAQLIGLLERSQYRVVPTEAPDVPRPDWAAALRWKIKDLVNFEISDAALDVLEIPNDAQLRRPPTAMVLAAPRDDIEKLAWQADDVGLDWAALSVPELALRNLSALAESGERAHALLALGETHGCLVITARGELLMSRQIEVPLSAFEPQPEGQDGGALDRAGLEVQRTLDSFERMFSHIGLARLSVALPKRIEATLLASLREMVYVQVERFNVPDLIDMQPADAALLDEADMGLLCALGAALRTHASRAGTQSINLLSAAGVGQPAGWNARVGERVLAATLAGVLLVGGTLTYAARHVTAQATELEQQATALMAKPGEQPFAAAAHEIDVLRQTEAMQTSLRDTLNQALANASGGYTEYLRALGRTTQPALWVTGLTIYPDLTLDLSGRMTDAAQLPIYLRALESEDRFRGRRFGQIDMKTVADSQAPGGSVIEFTLRSQSLVAKHDGKGSPR